MILILVLNMVRESGDDDVVDDASTAATAKDEDDDGMMLLSKMMMTIGFHLEIQKFHTHLLFSKSLSRDNLLQRLMHDAPRIKIA